MLGVTRPSGRAIGPFGEASGSGSSVPSLLDDKGPGVNF